MSPNRKHPTLPTALAAFTAALVLVACTENGKLRTPGGPELASAEQALSSDLELTTGYDAGFNWYTATLPLATVTGTISQTIEGTWDQTLHSPRLPPTYPQGWSLDYYAGATKLASPPSNAAQWATVSRVVTTGGATVEGVDGQKQAITSAITAPPVVVASSFSGGSAGDGWDVMFDPQYSRVFNIHHHDGPATLMCRFLTNSAACPGYPMALSRTPSRSTARIDAQTMKLWSPTSNSGKIAWDCVDIAANTRCSPAVVLSGFPQNDSGYDNHADPVVIGRKLYALARSPGISRITCLDMSTGTECPAITLAQNGTFNNAGLGAAGTKLFVLPGENLNLDCYESTTGARCAGSWPKAATRGPIWGVPSADGAVRNICTEKACWALDGSATTLPPNFVAYLAANPVIALSYTPIQYGKATAYGTKAAWVITSNRAACWDMVTDAKCAPAYPIAVNSMYAPTLDPEDPDCLWTNGDDGIIRNWKMSSGVQGCAGGPPRISFKASVSIPRLGCDPSSRVYQYKSFKLISPAQGAPPNGFSSATVTVINSNGANIPGWINLPLPANATIDLTGLSVAVAGDTPTFSVAAPGFTNTSIAPQAEFRVTTGSTPQLCFELAYPSPVCPTTAGIAGNAAGPPQATTVTAKGSYLLDGGAVTNYTDQVSPVNVSIDPPNVTNCGGYLTATAKTSGGTPLDNVQVFLLNNAGAAITDGSGNPVSAFTDLSGNVSFPVWVSDYKLRVTGTANYTPSTMTVTAGGSATTTASGGVVISGTVTSSRTAAASVNIVLNPVPPAAPAISLPAAGALLATRTPTVSGTCVTGATVTVFEGAATRCTTTCTAGAFSCATSSLADGSHTVFATQTNGYGTSVSSNTRTFTVDATPPAAPGITTPTEGLATNNPTPTFTGSCESAATVTVYEGAAVICSATCTGGSYSCTAAAQSEGPHSYTVTQQDAAGNTSAAFGPRNITVDLTNPAAPTVDVPTAGAFLATALPTLSGTCESGATVSLYEGSTLLCSATCASSAYSCISAFLIDGSHDVLARQKDPAGNTGPDSAPVTFTVDTTPPAAPVFSSPAAAAQVNVPAPTFSGSCEDFATVNVYEGPALLCTATCTGGTFSCTSTAALADGPHTFTTQQVDRAGNTSPLSSGHTFTVDTASPAEPVILLPTEGFSISDSTPALSGTCESGATVTVYEGSSPLCSATCVSGGFSCDSSTLTDGSHAVTARQTDVAGNVSAQSPVRNFIVDTTAPAAPAVTAPLAASFTADTTPALSGTCETDASVSVYEGSTLLCSATCVGGAFTCTSALLTDGSHTVFARQTDVAGNVSIDGATRQFTVDSTLPTAPVLVEPSAAFTNDTTPTVSGTCETDSTVKVYEGATMLCSSLCAAGAFSCDSSALSEGSHTIIARQTDRADNVSGDSNGLVFTVDITPPAAAAINVPVEGLVTTDTAPTIAGRCEPFAAVKVMEGSTQLCAATCLSTGLFVCDAPVLAEGQHVIVAVQTDRAGNAAPASAARTFTVDTENPAGPVISSPAAGSFLATATPVLSGSCESGTRVHLYEGTTALCQTTCSAAKFACTSSPLQDGEHTVHAQQTDLAGNVGAVSASIKFTVDTANPAAPTVTTPSGGAQVYDVPATFSGTAEPGSTVTVTVNGQTACTTTADEQGHWSCTGTVAPGAAVVSASSTDAAGNRSPASPGIAFTQRDAIDVPRILSPTNGARVNGPELTVSGTARAAASVTITDDTGATVCTATAGEDGAFQCTGQAAAGERTLTPHSSWRTFQADGEPVAITVLIDSEFGGGGCGCSNTGGAEPLFMLAFGAATLLARRRRAPRK